MTIRTELEALFAETRELVPAKVVQWAAENPESALHKALEWDDARAAGEYRLLQVRRLIAIHVVDEGGDRRAISLSIDRVKDLGGYRDVADIVLDPELASVMLTDALAELRRVQKKYRRVRALTGIWSAIDAAGRKIAASRSAA